MQISDFTQKKCNSGKNIQFMPKKRIKLDMQKLASLLEKEKALLEVETPSLLIFRLNSLQIDLNKNGKTVLKTENSKEAGLAFQKILPALSSSVE